MLCNFFQPLLRRVTDESVQNQAESGFFFFPFFFLILHSASVSTCLLMPVWKRRLPGQLPPLSGGIFVSVSCCGTRAPCSLQVEGFLLFLSALTPVAFDCGAWNMLRYVILLLGSSGQCRVTQQERGHEPVNNILSSTGLSRKCGVTCWFPC